MLNWTINDETLQDLINIGTGLFAPLDGFMGRDDFLSVVDNMTLEDGKSVWTIPITLDVDENTYGKSVPGERILLFYRGVRKAVLTVRDSFLMEDRHIEKIFRTLDSKHPGVAKEKSRYPYRVGGKVAIEDLSLFAGALNPAETKAHFGKMGWRTVAGFQTRNPIHNAHEHLQRLGLEICDAIFINPIMGWKKSGDFTEKAVSAAYEVMLKQFYPQDRVFFAGLRTQMRYAGPREAVFHATIRRNLGCTHFIIGRDHAGVGGYYGAYDAHALASELSAKYNLGIELLLFNEPYYCSKCGMVTSNKACSHERTHRIEISGTLIRESIKTNKNPPECIMRPEIFEALMKLDKIFID